MPKTKRSAGGENWGIETLYLEIGRWRIPLFRRRKKSVTEFKRKGYEFWW